MKYLKEPICPNCGKSEFVYKQIWNAEHLTKTEESLQVAKKANNERAIKVFAEKLSQKPTMGGIVGILFYCRNCGTIIGTGGGYGIR